MKIWTTCTYTPMTLNLLSVKQLKGSVKTLKGSYGKNLKNMNTKISCVQKPRKKPEKEEIHNSQLKDSKRWSENGEKNGENLNVSKYKSNPAVVSIMKGGRMVYVYVEDLEVEEIQKRVEIATIGAMREKHGSYIFFKHK